MGFIGAFINSKLNFEGSARSNGFAWSTTAEDVLAGTSLEGKNFVVTGANTGEALQQLMTTASVPLFSTFIFLHEYSFR